VTLRKEFTASDIDAFAKLSGDFNPIHVDEEFARQTRFRRRIAHGMLSGAYVSTLIGMHLPGPGALWLQQSFEFVAPVFIGDEIEFRLRVEHKSEATRTLLIGVEARNQQGVLVVKGQGKVMVLEKQEGRA
jgi:acyl dehydratase